MATVVPGGLLSNPMLTVLVVDEPSDASMASLKSSPSIAAIAVMKRGERPTCIVALHVS